MGIRGILCLAALTVFGAVGCGGQPQSLVFTIQPTDGTAGAALSPTVQVSVVDAKGRTVLGAERDVTVALSGGAGGTLAGTTTVKTHEGVATFTNLSIARAGTGYTLAASGAKVEGATSSSFAINPGPASQMVVTSQPLDSSADGAIGPPVQVTLQDGYGNTVTSSTASIKAALAPTSTKGTLSGTTTATAVGGVATFPALALTKAASGYSLAFTTTGVFQATSSAFKITPGKPAKLVFSTLPSSATAGTSLSSSVTVTVQDKNGNTVTNFTGPVTVAIGTNAGGATLSGTVTQNAVAGVATFTNLSLDKVGSGYTLTATSGALPATTSGAFAIAPAAAFSLAFSAQPSNAVAGAALSPAVQVSVLDKFGNTVTGNAATIGVALTAGSGATLLGTTSVGAVQGVATFSTLSVQKVGTYTLTATAGALAAGVSASFTISPAAPAGLVFLGEPSDAVAGVAIAPAVTVAVQDAYGNLVTGATNSVSLSLALNPGSATLMGTLTQPAVGGVATFADLSIQKAWTGYALGASSSGLSGATSSAFNINPAAAASLAFSTQPSNTVAGAAISPAVVVGLLDQYGNAALTSTASVTLALAANPGGATLLGTTTQGTVNGQATFGDLALQKTGAGYTLSATAASLTTATSSTFNITPAADAQLAFSVQPSNTNIGQPIAPAVQVAILDSYGNQTASTSAVTVSLASGPSGATLSGTLTRSAVNGAARFADLSLDTKGTGYALQAASGSLTGATSNTFTVFQPVLAYTNPAAGGKLALVQNPATTAATVVLDLVATQDITGYSVGMNLPVDGSKVVADAALMTPGTALNAGTGVVAAAAALPTAGPLANVLTSGQSQKAAGGGAITTNTTVPAGSVLYTLRLDVNPAAGAGTVFDGSTLASNPKFRALLRDLQGTDVAGSTDFAVGQLVVQLQ